MLSIFSRYRPRYLFSLAYMLQQSEYEPMRFLKWYWRVRDFAHVQKRSRLKLTKAAILVLLWFGFLGLIFWLFILSSVLLIDSFGFANQLIFYVYILFLIWLLPRALVYITAAAIAAANLFVGFPRSFMARAKVKKTLSSHKAVKIAVAGSYGKTTMKDLLATVLAEGKKVAVTPGNMNVALSHLKWAKNLSGKEEVLIIEYGEGRPGDIAKFAGYTVPDISVITGVAAAHLDKYGSTKEAGKDIFSLSNFVGNQSLYVNGESQDAKEFIRVGQIVYDRSGVGKWKVKNLKIDLSGVVFQLSSGKKKINVKSELIGEHQVGPLAAVAAIAERLGLTLKQIERGINKTLPFEHRMQPKIVGGAYIIDDTYNGNIDGIRAGLSLLKKLPAKRKIYITPGLVDQGQESQKVHFEMGGLIAKARPDILVLMQNSVTNYIRHGLNAAKFKGELKIEDDPLGFYTNIEQFVAAGDLVLMQNDWPDQYN